MRVAIATYYHTHIFSLVSLHTRKCLQKSYCDYSAFIEVAQEDTTAFSVSSTAVNKVILIFINQKRKFLNFSEK